VKGTGPGGRILKADIEDYLGELSFLVLQPLNLCLVALSGAIMFFCFSA
jgi:hypothetical protein